MRSCVSHVARGDPLLLYTFIISLSTAILYDAIKSILSFCVSPLIMPCTLRSFLGWTAHSNTSLYLNTQKMSCWSQSYDPTDGLPSAYKMMKHDINSIDGFLMRPYDIKHDKTQQCDHATSPPKRKSQLHYALYPKCLGLKYHMTFKHIHFPTYKMPLVNVVCFNRWVMTELDLISAYLT